MQEVQSQSSADTQAPKTGTLENQPPVRKLTRQEIRKANSTRLNNPLRNQSKPVSKKASKAKNKKRKVQKKSRKRNRL